MYSYWNWNENILDSTFPQTLLCIVSEIEIVSTRKETGKNNRNFYPDIGGFGSLR